MFEVSALSCQRISVALEHPYEESMATIEFNLTDCANITCKIYSINTNYDAIAVKLSKIIQSCMSIPVTLRALLRSWEQESKALRSLDNGNFNLPLGPNDPGGRNNGNGNNNGDFRDAKIKTERNGNGGPTGTFNNSGTGPVGNVTTTTNSGPGNGNARAMFQQQTSSILHTPSFSSEHSMFSTGSVTTAASTLTVTSDSNFNNQMQMTSSGSGGGVSTTGIIHELPYTDEKSAKRRRTEDFWKSPKSELTNSTDQLLENSNNSSDSNSLGISLSATATDTGVATTNSIANVSILMDTDISMDASTTMTSSVSVESFSKKNSIADCNLSEISNPPDMVEAMRKKHKKMVKDEKCEEGTKLQQQQQQTSGTGMAPSVSITPITTSTTGATSSGFSSVLTGLEKRLGIEIIPISSTPAPSIKSSITITPINTTKTSSSEKKSSSSSSSSGGNGSSSNSTSGSRKPDDRSKLEKKKKRKREDAPMGPPDKMPPKQDPLSRPVSVSIKTTDGAPLSPSGLLRKFTNSPVHGKSSNSSGSSTGMSVTSSGGGVSASSTNKPSAKLSPAHHSSPKHQGISSPKAQYGTSSPKHLASGSGSGKPSINALKTASNSPSSKSGGGGGGSGEKTSTKSSSSSSSSSSRDGSRERDRDKDKDRDRDRDKDRSLKYSSSGSNSPKLPKSTVKLKQIDMTSTTLASTPPSSVDALLDASSSSQDSTKSTGGSNSNASTKIRKGSLSAVIDKLKSAQHVSDELIGTGVNNQQIKSNAGMSQTGSSFAGSAITAGIGSMKEKVCGSSSPSLMASLNASSSLKNSEYMVKPSSDGMKITINKTRTKESSLPSPSASSSSSKMSSGSNSGSNSPKTHTGLKPGVNSGPASKKPSISGVSSQNNNKISGTGSNSGSGVQTSSSSKLPFQRSSSSGGLSASSSSSKSLSSKSMSSVSDSFGKKDRNRTSSSSTSSSSNKGNIRHDHVDVMKIVSLAAQSQSMEGYIKTFDTKFQIPKLSARTNVDDSKKEQMMSASATAHNSPMSNLMPSTSTSITQSTAGPNNSNSSSGEDAAKMLMDFFSGKDKYGYGLGKFSTNDPTTAITSQYMNNTLANMSRSATSPKYSIPDSMQFNKDLHLYKSSSSDGLSSTMKEFRDKHFSLSNPTTPTNTVAPPFPSPLSFTHPSTEKSPSHPSPSESPKINHLTMHQSMRPPSAPPISAHLSSTVSQETSAFKSSSTPIDSGALDFSSPSLAKSEAHQLNKQVLAEQRNSMVPLPSSMAPHRKVTPSPSVQLHIVKSPVPSPLVVNPSPHSNSSPCITDDELMDEALVGIGGK